MAISFSDGSGTVVLDAIASCQVTEVTAFNVTSHLFDGGTAIGAIILEISSDEGFDPWVSVSQLRGELEALIGQDNAGGGYWGATGEFGETADQMVLEPLTGLTVGNAVVSYNLPIISTASCANVTIGNNYPFAAGETPEFVDAFDERLQGASQYSVLGQCFGDGSLLLSTAGVLQTFELDGSNFTTIQVNSAAEFVTYLTQDGPTETLIDQQGGDRYLGWVVQPTVPGGLAVIEFC